MTRSTRRQASSTGEWLVSKARSNPEGLLLLAAGAALLLRSGSAFGPSGAATQRPQQGPGAQDAGWPGADQLSKAADSARQYASEFGEKVSDLGSTVSETAGTYADSASRYVGEATRFASERSSEFVAGARSTFQETTERVLREQPLLIALAGLAAGAAVAAAFPRTDMEERTLGPAGERLTRFASETAEQVKDAGMKAGERLMSGAQERGLSADGLKEMAHEAAEVFGTAFSGQEGQSGASGTAQSGSGGTSQSRPSVSAPRRSESTTGASVVAPETTKPSSGR